MVAVPELPADPAHYVRCLAEAGYFEAVAFTAEDRDARRAVRGRTPSARACATRRRAWTSSCGGLDMTRGVRPGAPRRTSRASAQLINKTNQFNTTTIRRTRGARWRRWPPIPAA